MTSYKLFLLAGDGIGPEVMGELKAIVSWFNSEGIARFEIEQGLVGGAAYDAHGEAISESDMARAQASDAVLFEPRAIESVQVGEIAVHIYRTYQAKTGEPVMCPIPPDVAAVIQAAPRLSDAAALCLPDVSRRFGAIALIDRASRRNSQLPIPNPQ